MSNESVSMNGMIFKELIKRGYSSEGDHRVWNIADSKLWYLTPDQSKAYLDLENSEGYKGKVEDAEPELLKKCVGELKTSLKKGENINIVDLGCGDGKKAAGIINGLKGHVNVRYCPIDISAYMVNEAIKTVSGLKVKEIIESQWNISDFENLRNITPLLRLGDFKKNIVLLLGYTLGNFEIHELLYEIRSSMKGEDLLVIVDGIGNNKWEKRAEECKNDEKTNHFFKKIPLLLGIDEDNLTFAARFVHSRIEFFYTLKRDQTVTFRGRSVDFKKGDMIITAISSKHGRDELKSTLNLYFDSAEIHTSSDGSTALAICKK